MSPCLLEMYCENTRGVDQGIPDEVGNMGKQEKIAGHPDFDFFDEFPS